MCICFKFCFSELHRFFQEKMKKLIQNITIYCTQNVSIKVYGLQNCYLYALEVKCFPNYGRFRYGHYPHRNESYDLKEE